MLRRPGWLRGQAPRHQAEGSGRPVKGQAKAVKRSSKGSEKVKQRQ